jgi:hypothetical protein
LIAIQSAVGQAERIVFLGCAYHAQNVDVLFGSARERVNATILGTCYKMRPRAKVAVQQALTAISPSVLLEDKTCAELLTAHDDSIF